MTSVARRREQDDSGEYSDASQDIEQNNSGNDGGQPESDYDSRGSDSEHSDREDESQEGQTERRVDDDEDRSNPQYIPKRGTFYEHDDRTAASGEESNNVTSETASEKKEGSETPSERRRAPRKSETINKWSHDKYNENEQMPKSRDELVAIYGYDIRNEDAPPHARRNRRYGRGPNKYTRTWEDEEAYKRQTAAAAQHRKPPNPEDFPELDGKFSRRPRTRPRSKSQPASNESSENGSVLRRNASIKTPKGKTVKQAATRPLGNKPSPKPPAAKDKMPPLENLTITATVFNNSHGPQRKVSTAPVAQQRPVPTEQAKRKPVSQTLAQTSPATGPSKQPQTPQQQQSQQQNTQQTQQNQQAAGTEHRGGSKRYSSLRQRPLAETYSPQQTPQQQQQKPQQQQPLQQPPPQQSQQPQPPQQQQPHRYHGEYVAGGQPPSQHQGSPVPQIHPQQIMHPVHRTPAVSQPPHGPSPPHQLPQHPPQHPPQVPIPPVLDHTQQQVRLGILEQQQMVSHPHHNMHQPHSIGQLQPAQGYAPPAIMPAQYMQQQSSSGAVYGSPLYQPPAAYPHQIYPHHNFVPPQQATQAGGVTYYSCAEQEQQPRAQRRPTAAIPIVKPAAPERPANSTEKDNIDRIVENMFVRKPWPATHGADSKDKPADQSRGSQEPPSKESSQPNSLTSSSISTDSKPSESKEDDKEPQLAASGAPAALGNPVLEEKQEQSTA